MLTYGMEILVSFKFFKSIDKMSTCYIDNKKKKKKKSGLPFSKYFNN